MLFVAAKVASKRERERVRERRESEERERRERQRVVILPHCLSRLRSAARTARISSKS